MRNQADRPFVVGASEEVLKDLALRQHRVPAHAVHEALQLVHPVLDELLLVATCGEVFRLTNLNKKRLEMHKMFNESMQSLLTIINKTLVKLRFLKKAMVKLSEN